MRWRCRLCGDVIELSKNSINAALGSADKDEREAFLCILKSIKEGHPEPEPIVRVKVLRDFVVGVLYWHLVRKHPPELLAMLKDRFEEVTR